MSSRPCNFNDRRQSDRFYRLDKSRSQRILWLLEETKLDFEVKTYHRQPNMRAPPDLQKIHPLGKSPILTIEQDGMSGPLVLAESGFMTEYIIDHFATHLAPKRWKDGQEGQVGGETEAWLRYRYLMHFAEGSVMPNLLLMIVASSKHSFATNWTCF